VGIRISSLLNSRELFAKKEQFNIEASANNILAAAVRSDIYMR
jgi:hypothetical protein